MGYKIMFPTLTMERIGDLWESLPNNIRDLHITTAAIRPG